MSSEGMAQILVHN